MRKFFLNQWNIVLTLLFVLFLIAIPGENFRFVLWVVVGVISAALCELALGFFIRHKLTFPRSAIISGFIVSGIISYYEPLYYVAIFAAIAIVSKYLITYRHRHIFNPANFSLCVATLFSLPLTWTIESNVYLVIIVGLYLVYTLRKLHHVIGFVISFSALIAFTKINPAMMLGWFFILIMVIEPKTSGGGRLRGLVFGVIVGVSAFLFYQFLPKYDFLVLALFIGNLFNPLLARIPA